MESWKKNLWILWFGSFIVSSSFSMVIPFLPLFLIELGVTKHTEMWSGLLFSSAFLPARSPRRSGERSAINTAVNR